jgi:hypothetical protein
LLVAVAGAVIVTSCSAPDKCGRSPVVNATWPGHKVLLYQCGGAFFAMPSIPPSQVLGGGPPDVEMSVGQRLTLTKGAGWSGFSASDPFSDAPGVLRLITGPSASAIAVYVAVAPGVADVGARSGVCGDAASGCLLGVVRVDP